MDGADRMKIVAYDPDASWRMTTGIGTATAGGDLSGSLPGPTVTGIEGYPIDLTGLANGDVLYWDSGTSTWKVTIPGGLTNPMTTKGDIIIADTGGTPLRLGAGSSGDVLTANGAGTLPSWQAPAGSSGGLVLLEQHTASSSASLDFTTAISSTYDEYLITIVGIVPATNAAIPLIRASTNGGASYDSGSNYDNESFRIGGGGTNYVGGSSTGVQLSPGVGMSSTASLGGVNGRIFLYSPAASAYKTLEGDTAWYYLDGSTRVRSVVSGSYLSTTAVNAFQVVMDSGNIASGIVRCYGVAK
jgi:hypothetical protein